MGIKNPGFRSFTDWDPGFLSACRFLYPPGHSFSRHSKGAGLQILLSKFSSGLSGIFMQKLS